MKFWMIFLYCISYTEGSAGDLSGSGMSLKLFLKYCVANQGYGKYCGCNIFEWLYLSKASLINPGMDSCTAPLVYYKF